MARGHRKPKVSATLARDRRGTWVVKISMPNGLDIVARDGATQSIVYSNPQRVPTHLRSRIVPDLMREARRLNLADA